MKRRFGFTLTEIIVALGVFSILLAIMMRFFTSAQTITTSSEAKNEFYADARVAMNLMGDLLSEAIILNPVANGAGEFPFLIERRMGPGTAGASSDKSENSDRIYFYTRSRMRLCKEERGNGDVYLVSFQISPKAVDPKDQDTYNPLCISVLGDRDPNTFDVVGATFNASTPPKSVLDSQLSSSNTNGYEVIRYVTGLSFEPMVFDAGGNLVIADAGETGELSIPQSAAPVRKMPVAINIRIKLLDRTAYDTYLGYGGRFDASESAAAKSYRLANERAFVRMVMLQPTYGN